MLQVRHPRFVVRDVQGVAEERRWQVSGEGGIGNGSPAPVRHPTAAALIFAKAIGQAIDDCSFRINGQPPDVVDALRIELAEWEGEAERWRREQREKEGVTP